MNLFPDLLTPDAPPDAPASLLKERLAFESAPLPLLSASPRREPLPCAQLVLGDGLEWMKAREAHSLDLICTDPPYASLDRHRATGTTTRLGGHHQEDKRAGWFDSISNERLFEFLRDCHRALRPHTHLWILCDHETSGYIQAFVRYNMMDLRDARTQKRLPAKEQITYVKDYPVIKCAASGGVRTGTGYHGRATTERAVLIKKGNRALTDQNWPDFFTPVWDGDSDSRLYTPDGQKYDTAKPVMLLERLIELSTQPGEWVADSFMGSGPCVQAALQMGRNCIGIDKRERAFHTASKRVEHFEARAPFFEITSAHEQKRALHRKARMHALPAFDASS